METLAHGIAGSAGGMLAMALLYPLDQIKTIMQVEANALEEEPEQEQDKKTEAKPPTSFWTQALLILRKKKWQVYQGHVSTQVALKGSNFIYFFWCVEERVVAALRGADACGAVTTDLKRSS
ncbi:hypothetical protein PR003_g10413 [Phytophthora rubi]|uniref:Uncharacterized protein n=1 Tax=Phytophthora rubi TaxID=129364 RepID=A0A6A4FFC7_9STRA|nr:hypothetical protein PR003_g10413 [Phytophthora rubi]